MTTDAAAAYGLFTGRFSGALSRQFLDFTGAAPGEKVLDVGCGPGALTEVLVERLGAVGVAAVDPSEAYVASVRRRLPGVDARVASAEDLPFPDGVFDATLAQLVVHFLADPVAGLREMARVTRPGGVVAACVWDNAGGAGPLSPLWRAARDLDPEAPDESGVPGAAEGELAVFADRAGLVSMVSGRVDVEVRFASFAEWWRPLTLGVGSGGAYVASLAEGDRLLLGAHLERGFGPGPFSVAASAWCVRAEVPA